MFVLGRQLWQQCAEWFKIQYLRKPGKKVFQILFAVKLDENREKATCRYRKSRRVEGKNKTITQNKKKRPKGLRLQAI